MKEFCHLVFYRLTGHELQRIRNTAFKNSSDNISDFAMDYYFPGRSGIGLVASASDVQCDRTQAQITPQTVVFIVTAAAIYSFGHGLHAFTALPRSTQRSTFRAMVKWAYGLRNNNNVAKVDMDGSSLPVDSQPKVFGLVWGLAAIWRSVCTRWTLAMALSHDDSTINIIICISNKRAH